MTTSSENLNNRIERGIQTLWWDEYQFMNLNNRIESD